MDPQKSVRVWVDGCFDMVHFGHSNLVRQAKCKGDYLIVGIHSDEEIMKHKGPPVFNQEERYTLLSAIKWVDKVVKDAPYMTQIDVLDHYNCDFVVHGDDISVMQDGGDAYEVVKKANRYMEVSRTEGISTTDLLYRILKAIDKSKPQKNGHDVVVSTLAPVSSYTSGAIHYMPTALRIAQFMSSSGNPDRLSLLADPLDGIREPGPADVVVYVPGAFDLFHVGHVEFLKKCRQLGSYIIVGLHSDETATLEKGRIGPILNMHERLLPLLACRYVNNVIMDAPLKITNEMIDFFKIKSVVVGKHTEVDVKDNENDPMIVPKKRKIFHQIDSGSDVTTRQVITRIIENQQAFEARNKAKESKEVANHVAPV